MIHLVQDQIGGGGAIATEYILLEDQKTTGTGGGTPTADTWNVRDLNTEVFDTGNNCTLSSNRFTLDEGTYDIYVRAPMHRIQDSMLRLVADPAGTPTYTYGASAFGNSNTNGVVQTYAFLNTRITVPSGGETYEIQQWADASTTNGFGQVTSTHGIGEKFTIVEIRKIS